MSFHDIHVYIMRYCENIVGGHENNAMVGLCTRSQNILHCLPYFLDGWRHVRSRAETELPELVGKYWHMM